MAQANVDPAELRRFAQHLKHFAGDLERQMVGLHGQLVDLGQTWRDREHQKFTEEFEEAMKALARCVESTNQYVPFLMRKADRVEEYLQQR